MTTSNLGAGTSLRRLLAATAVSDSANGVFAVAAVLGARQLGGSAPAVAAVGAAATLPWLLAVPAGMLVDRVDRARAITACNLGRGALMLALGALLLIGAPAVPALVVVVFGVAVLQTVVDTAAESLVPDLVRAAELTRANGYLAVSTRLCHQAVGPLAAGLLFEVSAPTPVLVAGVGCAAAVVLLRGARARPTAPASPARLRTGVVLIARSPVLAATVAVSALTTLVNGAFMTVFVLYAISPGPLGLGESEYGLLLALVGLGAAGGSVLTSRFEALVGRGHLLWLTRVGWAAVFAAPVLLSGVALVVVVTLGSFVGGMWSVLAMTARQRNSEPRHRGQVAGASRMITYGCAPIGAGLGGVLGEFLEPRAIFLGAAVATLATILLLRPAR
ncbi:MFS transporter [Saccharothrix syringae]|uniref:MFS transporter n=1 Tax=Saccharothrix syringae TaxID=103733 RepID=A0A5Q0H2P2_SACSY|nr:MFS transporter [Saccharothrix syringae]QFZ19962.1 MFS transporter [Saccharothrix syringae]